MTAAPVQPRLVQLGRAEFAAHLDEAIDVYVTAMGYPRGTARQRRSRWLEHAYRPGWRAVAWLGEGDRVIGVSYGYWGGPGQWWFEEVRRGLRALRGSGAEAAGLGVGVHVQLGQLEVVGQPALGLGTGAAQRAQPAAHLLEPPLTGTAPVAVGHADHPVVLAEPRHRTPTGPAGVRLPAGNPWP